MESNGLELELELELERVAAVVCAHLNHVRVAPPNQCVCVKHWHSNGTLSSCVSSSSRPETFSSVGLGLEAMRSVSGGCVISHNSRSAETPSRGLTYAAR